MGVLLVRCPFSFGGLGGEDGDTGFTGQHHDFGTQVGRVAVGFEGIEDVAQ